MRVVVQAFGILVVVLACLAAVAAVSRIETRRGREVRGAPGGAPPPPSLPGPPPSTRSTRQARNDAASSPPAGTGPVAAGQDDVPTSAPEERSGRRGRPPAPITQVSRVLAEAAVPSPVDPEPVEVLIAGVWLPGTLDAWRYAGARWEGRVVLEVTPDAEPAWFATDVLRRLDRPSHETAPPSPHADPSP